MAETKTDNDYLVDKVAIRIANIPQKKILNVLDAFGGKGVVWRTIERKTKRKIIRVAIDERYDLTEFHLHGDNSKIMQGMDLSRFDVIDLDAYGCPTEQIEIVKNSGFKGIVFVTFIQSMNGAMPKKMLVDIGFPEAITTKAPSVPARRGWEFFKQWLAKKDVLQISHRSKGRKHYLAFGINGAELHATDCNIHQGDTFANPS